MIKINTKTLEATRESVRKELNGLDFYTLQNLQSVLKPVPDHLLDLEYWPENDTLPSINEMVEKYGDEVYSVDATNKVVNVSRQVIPLTAEEIAEKQAIAETDALRLAMQSNIESISQDVLLDAEITQIRTMTVQQIADHFAAKTTLTDLRESVVKMAKILVLLAKDELPKGALRKLR